MERLEYDEHITISVKVCTKIESDLVAVVVHGITNDKEVRNIVIELSLIQVYKFNITRKEDIDEL